MNIKPLKDIQEYFRKRNEIKKTPIKIKQYSVLLKTLNGNSFFIYYYFNGKPAGYIILSGNKTFISSQYKSFLKSFFGDLK